MRQPITPYLTVKGADSAITFYRQAFDATEVMRRRADDGRRLLHAELTINGASLMLSDEFPEHGGSPAPTPQRPTSVAISLAFQSPAELNATFGQAVAAGAQIWMEPADMFWGGRLAMLDDPFGHRWMLTAPT